MDVKSAWFKVHYKYSYDNYYYKLEEPIMKLLYGTKERPSRVRLYLRRKWTDFDEIWNSVNQMLGAGLGRLWARSAQ